jgi:glycosyltransferase involved in cell wall biosynthesis
LKIPVLQKTDVIVVVPAFNEAASIRQVLIDIRSSGFDALVVDDGSTDSTAFIARECGARVVSLPLNAGVGGALRCGFRYAVENGFSAIIQCDADGQHLSQHLADLVEASNSMGSHMVIGSRFRSAQNTLDPSTTRRFAMWWLARVARFATQHPITDSTSGFRIIRQPLLGEFAQHLPSYYLGDTFEALVVAGRSGYVVQEIGVAMAPRASGTSSASSGRAIVLIAKSLATVLLGLHFRIRRLK